jgi:hypothetical protein
MDDFCKNIVVCMIHSIQDPNSIPDNGYTPVAQWYASFVTYLLFQNFWIAYGTTSIFTASKYALMTWLLWAKNDYVYDWILYHGIDFSDLWISTMLVLSGIFIAFLLCYVLDVPVIVRNPWKHYDEIKNLGGTVSMKMLGTREQYLWHTLKYYAFVLVVQYGGTAIFFLFSLVSQRATEYAIVLYFFIQLLLIVIFSVIGYRNTIETQYIWNNGLLKYALFIICWFGCFLYIYALVFIFNTVLPLIVILFATLLLSVVLMIGSIIRCTISQ